MSERNCDMSGRRVSGRLRTLMPGVRAATVFLIVALLGGATSLTARAGAAANRQLAVMMANGELRILDPGGGVVRTLRTPAGSSSPTWSPGDKTLAYGSVYGGGRITLQPATGGAETPLVVGNWPSWSPVANEIAYWTFTSDGQQYGYRLHVIGADGANDRVVAGPFIHAIGGYPPTWSPDGKRLAFQPDAGGPIDSVSASGGGAVSTIVAQNPNGIDRLALPAFAPTGNRIAYVRSFPYAAFGPVHSELVVRDLATQHDQVVADSTPASQAGLQGSGSPAFSWSADGEHIAYIESEIVPVAYQVQRMTMRVVTMKLDGSDRNVLMEETKTGTNPSLDNGPTGVAWANSNGPSYYIKDVEVAQAISPDLEPPSPLLDPLFAGPYLSHWSVPAVAGYSIPLIAEKSTLLRIYVGDARLSAGQTERRPMHFRVFDQNDPSITYEATVPVDVTARDVAPAQATEQAALNFWLPPEAAKSGELHSFKVDINTDQSGAVEPECGGCFPNGNEATLQGVRFEDGGSMVIAPVPIYEITPDSRTVLQPNEADLKLAVHGAVPMLPIGDGGVTFAQQPGPGLLIDQRDKGFKSDGGCDLMLAKLQEYRATAGIAGPVGGLGATRSVGYAPKPFTAPNAIRCRGKADLPGSNLVLLGPTSERFVHELGHTLGLTHVTGHDPTVAPAGATPLGYPGIGGVGYGHIIGAIMEVFDKTTTGDVMSYDEQKWTSPKTWHVMYEKILAESGAIRPQADVASAKTTASQFATRRLVTGILQGSHTTILDSVVTQATDPAGEGPKAARVVARDDRGHTLAQTPIRGTLTAEQGESRPSLPFVVALPDNKKIASLEVMPPGKGKPLATLRRSKHAPQGRLLNLPRRASAARALTLRWRATDRDRGNRVSVAILARRGTGRFRTLLLGPAAGRMALDPRTLGKGNKLSVRLLISDGLSTTVVNARPIALGGRR